MHTNTRRTLLTAAALAGVATLAAPTIAHADTTSTPTITQTVDTSKPGAERNGWIWQLPDGSTMGQCAAGYGPQWNTVHDYTSRVYSATEDQNGTAVRVNGLTWAQWSDLMATSGVRNPLWYYVGDLNAGTETTNPVGFVPPVGGLYEGDCVLDGTALPTPNDHFDGGGKSYPIVPTPTAPASSATPTAPASSATPTKAPSTPAKPTPKPVVYYQHDTIKITSRAQAAELAARIHAGVLPYRGDRLSWGHSAWTFTTTPGHNTGHAVVGQTVTLYWVLDTAHGAKPTQAGGLAWGPKHNLVQKLVK